jgi:hypothetical protein
MKVKRIITILLMSCIFLSGCSSEPSQEEETWIIVQENIVSFTDGETVDLWRSDYGPLDVYKLSDGTILLEVKDPSGPANTSVFGVEDFDDLSEIAQKAVLAFYEKQELLYDVQTELKKAYDEYLSYKNSEQTFNRFFLSQDVFPTCSNDNIMCFRTSVRLPIGNRIAQEIRLGAAFDRKTGEVLNVWDLFSSSENKGKEQVLDAAQITVGGDGLLDRFIPIKDTTLVSEMEKALKDEYIIFFPDNLKISFPQGTLPSIEHSYILRIDYTALDGIIQEWAIPYSSK